MGILMVTCFLSGIILIVFSKNKKHYASLVEENNEEFAQKNVHSLKKGGRILIFLPLFYYFIKYLFY